MAINQAFDPFRHVEGKSSFGWIIFLFILAVAAVWFGYSTYKVQFNYDENSTYGTL